MRLDVFIDCDIVDCVFTALLILKSELSAGPFEAFDLSLVRYTGSRCSSHYRVP